MPDFDRWLDLDLDAEARRIKKATGSNPRTSGLGEVRPILEDKYAEEIIPYEQLKDVIAQKDADGTWMSELITRIFDQMQEGACVTDAIGQCHEICQCKEVGPSRVVHVSAMSIYHWIARGPNSGSNLDDALEQIKTVGILPWNTAENQAAFKHTHPNTGYYEKFMPGWEETAGLFKGLEELDIRGPEGFWSAICKGWPVMYARSGHCITGCRLFWKNGKLVLGYCNSWARWGDVVNPQFPYGMGYDSESVLRNASYGAIAFRQVSTPVAA